MMLVGWANLRAVVVWGDPADRHRQARLVCGRDHRHFAINGLGSGPTGAFIPELFATRYRYSGSALAVNLAGVLGGAVPPLIAGTLLATYGSWSIGVMLAVLALTSLVCTYLLPETIGSLRAWR